MSVSKLIGKVLLCVGVVAAVAIAMAPWINEPRRIDLLLSANVSNRSAAYFVDLPADDNAVLRPVRDARNRLKGEIRLLEDGRPIGYAVADFESVVNRGAGRFAYRHPTVAFSTEDGSDPRHNGRSYAIERPVKARLLAWGGAGVAIIVGLSLAFPIWTRNSLTAALRFGPRPVEWRTRSESFAWASALSVTVLIVIAQLFWVWSSSSSSHFGIAGYLPVSDALGYYNCAVWIGAIDTNVSTLNDWCARRILYPSMLSAVLGLTGWRPSVALLLQAAALGLSGGVLLLALRRMFSWVTAVLTTFGVLAFAAETAVGVFVTEAFGLATALVGLALLLLSVRHQEPAPPALLLFGLTLISVAMSIRAGALFALPLLLLWLLVITRSMARRSRAKLAIAAVAAIAAGPVLQYGVSMAVGANPANSAGNFATTLYGLATGSRDWSQAERDFGDVFGTQSETTAFRVVREAALERIVHDPSTFLGSLVAAGTAFAKSLFAFGVLAPYNALTSSLFCFGLLLCAQHFRRPAASLLLILCAGEFISAPFIYDSGGHRVLAVTVGARLAVAAYAVGWLFGLLMPNASNRNIAVAIDTAVSSSERPLATVSVLLGAVFLLLAIVATTPISSLWRLQPLALAGACKADQIEVVAQPGRESMRITFGSGSLPLGDEELGSEQGEFELDPMSTQAWWARLFTPQPPDTALIYLVQRHRDNLGSIIAAYSRTPLPITNERPLSFCLARQPSADFKVGDLTGHEILTVVERSR